MMIILHSLAPSVTLSWLGGSRPIKNMSFGFCSPVLRFEFLLESSQLSLGLTVGDCLIREAARGKNPLMRNSIETSYLGRSSRSQWGHAQEQKGEDRDTRIKFACLAVVTSVLLPSSHTPKVNPDHVELICDVDEFMAYPWGRVSSLLKKDELALAQDSFALRCYVEAIKLVMIASVPELKEEVTPNAPVVVQESDSEDEENEAEASDQTACEKSSNSAKYVLIPAHAKTMDLECKISVILFLLVNCLDAC